MLTAYLAPLVARLRRDFPWVDETVLHDVATDHLLDLGMRPGQYDPARSSLSTYVRMAARRDVLNVLDRERRRARRSVPLDAVELHPPAQNSDSRRGSDPADAVIAAFDRDRLLALEEHFSAQDWHVVLLRIDGVRRTEPYAALLGLRDRPPHEQEREVNRVKERVMKRLRRLWRKKYGDD